MSEQMVWEDSTAFVSVSVWILSGVQGGSGVLLLVQETLGQFCEVQERPTRKATPTPDSKKRFVLELIKVLFPSGESLLYPYRAPPPKKKPGFQATAGPQWSWATMRRKQMLLERRERKTVSQTPCNKVSPALPGPEASKPRSPASSSRRRSMAWLLGSGSGLSRRQLGALGNAAAAAHPRALVGRRSREVAAPTGAPDRQV